MSKIDIGDKCKCLPTPDAPWTSPFIGQVEKFYENSAMVKIISTHEDDDELIDYYKGRTIIPIRRMGELRKI